MLLKQGFHSCKACKNALCHNSSCKDPIIGKDRKRYKCAQCLTVHYCSAQCQKAHWKEHRQTCKPWESVSIFDLARKAECPLIKKFGCHRHPNIKLSEAQKRIALDIHAMISQLDPLEPRYRFSCQCETPISDAMAYQVCISFYQPGEYAANVIAVCENTQCKQKQQVFPLILLQRIVHVDGEAYAAFPYHTFTTESKLETPSPVLINVSSKAFSELSAFANFDLEWVFFKETQKQAKDCKCGLKHCSAFPVLLNKKDDTCMLYNKEETKWELKIK